MEVGEGVKSFRQPSTDARLVTIDEKGRKRGVEEVSSSLPERLLFNFRQTRADDDEQECGFRPCLQEERAPASAHVCKEEGDSQRTVCLGRSWLALAPFLPLSHTG